jgi:hypothetical protein
MHCENFIAPHASTSIFRPQREHSDNAVQKKQQILFCQLTLDNLIYFTIVQLKRNEMKMVTLIKYANERMHDNT